LITTEENTKKEELEKLYTLLRNHSSTMALALQRLCRKGETAVLRVISEARTPREVEEYQSSKNIRAHRI
jgi:hypothetical protein